MARSESFTRFHHFHYSTHVSSNGIVNGTFRTVDSLLIGGQDVVEHEIPVPARALTALCMGVFNTESGRLRGIIAIDGLEYPVDVVEPSIYNLGIIKGTSGSVPKEFVQIPKSLSFLLLHISGLRSTPRDVFIALPEDIIPLPDGILHEETEDESMLTLVETMEEIDIPDGILHEETEDESLLTPVETMEEIDIPAWYIPWVSVDGKLVHPSTMSTLFSEDITWVPVDDKLVHPSNMSPLSPLTSEDGGDSFFSPVDSADIDIDTTATVGEEHESEYETPPASWGTSEPGDLFEAGPSKKRRVLAPEEGT